MKKVYTTFTYKGVRYAVECMDEDEANDVAMDAISVNLFHHVYIRKCGYKPRKAIVISVEEYREMF